MGIMMPETCWVNLKWINIFNLCLPCVLSSPTLMMHGHMNLKKKDCSSADGFRQTYWGYIDDRQVMAQFLGICDAVKQCTRSDGNNLLWSVGITTTSVCIFLYRFVRHPKHISSSATSLTKFSHIIWYEVRFSKIIYLLTPWSTVLLQKLTGSAASQEIPRLFGTRRFITVLTSALHLFLSWANSIQSPQPPPTSWRSILILSSHLRLDLPNGLIPSGFPTRTLCTPPPFAPHVPPISFFSILPPAQYSVRTSHINTNEMQLIFSFIWCYNSVCFGRSLRPSSGVL